MGGNPIKVGFTAATGPTVMRDFTELFQTTGKWKNDAGNDINSEDFETGNAFFVFQLEPYFT